MTRHAGLAGAALLAGLALAGCGSALHNQATIPTTPATTSTTTVAATPTTTAPKRHKAPPRTTTTTASTTTSTTTVPPTTTTTTGPVIDSQYVASSIQSTLVNESGIPATVTCPSLHVESAYQWCSMHSPQDNTTLPVRLSASSSTVQWSLLENGEVTFGGIVLLNESSPTTAPLTTAPLPSVTIGSWTGREPSNIYFSVDSGNIVEDITWSTWNDHAAVGHGIWHYEDCNPSCADGSFTAYPATITLGDPVGGVFTQLTEQASGPHGFTSTVALPEGAANAS